MAANPYDLFTPAFQKALARAGMSGPFTAGMAVGLAQRGFSEVTDADVDRTAPYYRLKAATGVEPAGWLSDEQDPAIQAAVQRGKQGTLTPEVAKLLGQLQKMREQERARGAEDTAPHKSTFMKVLDVLSRPGQAIQGALFNHPNRDEGLSGPLAFGANVGEHGLLGGLGREVKASAQGAVKGFTGQEQYHASQEIKNAAPWVPTPVAAVAGFGVDVGTDPVSYVSFGVGKRVAATGVERAAQARNTREGVEQILKSTGGAVSPERVRAAVAADVAGTGRVLGRREAAQLARAAAPAIEQTAVQVGAQAARTAKATLADDLIKVGMSPGSAKRSAASWLNATAKPLTEKQAAKRDSWLKLVESSPDTLKTALNTTTERVAAEAQEAAAKQMTELLAANITQQTRRTLKASFAGVPLGEVPIHSAVRTGAGALASRPMAAKALEAFGRTFNTGSHFDRELTTAKARSAGLAERRIEVARRELSTAFGNTAPEQRTAFMKALVNGPGAPTGLLKLADGRDAAEVAQHILEHAGSYVDWTGSGSGILKLTDINREMPHAVQFQKMAIEPVAGDPAGNMLQVIKRNREHLEGQDAAHYLYTLYLATEKAVARDQLGRAVAEFGVPTHLPQSVDPATGKILGRTPTQAAKELVSRHGYSPIVTKGRGREVSAAYDKHFDGLVFSPEVRKGIDRVLAIADNPVERGQVMRLFDKTQSSLKKFLTLPSPAFHIRNSFGDMWMGYLDDVKGARGAHSYEQAAKTMAAVRGERGNVVQNALNQAVDPVTGQMPDPLEVLKKVRQAASQEPRPGGRIMRTPRKWADVGDYLSAEELWAAYNHTGLNRGFIAADLESTLRSTSAVPKALGKVTDKATDFSQARENYFRMAHFIDRLKRSTEPTFAKAAEEAARYVRRFHFDYSDVTPTEQAVLARIFPFYKFQRFAVPLVTQMFFARPGKTLNTIRGLSTVSDAAGYSRDGAGLPFGDAVLPEYMRDMMLMPLWQSATGSTTYFNLGLPGTTVPLQQLGLSKTGGMVPAEAGRNLVSSVTPLALAPFELASGHRVFGGGVPTGPASEYFLSRTPLTNQIRQAGDEGSGASLVGFLSGLGLTENTPKRQKGEITREREEILQHRRRDKYTAPARPTRGRAGYTRSYPGRP